MRHLHRTLLFAITGISLLLPACKSHKPHVAKPSRADQKKREHLSEKLNLSLYESNNLALYTLIHEWLGVPHQDNGCTKSGTDCSCFVKMLLTEVYRKDVGRSSQEMYSKTQRIDQVALKEGDLVFFKIKSVKISHVGLYLQENKFVHVSSTKGVMISSLDEAYFKNSYAGAGRIK
jgi:lipoprotein Spr